MPADDIEALKSRLARLTHQLEHMPRYLSGSPGHTALLDERARLLRRLERLESEAKWLAR